jgi:hypothetical protein
VESKGAFEYLVDPEKGHHWAEGLATATVPAEEGHHELEGLATAAVEEVNHELEGLATAAVEEGHHELEGLAAVAAPAEEGHHELEGLAAVAAPAEEGHQAVTGAFAGGLEKRGRCTACNGFCGKPEADENAAIAPRAVRFVGNFANASDAALPIAAPILCGFAIISPMAMGLSFLVVMVKPLYRII